MFYLKLLYKCFIIFIISSSNKTIGTSRAENAFAFSWYLVHLVGEGNGTHSSTVARKIPWMEEPGRLQSTGSAKSQTWLSDFTFTFHFHALEKEMATHSSVLAWRIPWTEKPGGLQSMGSHRVRHDWSDLAAAAVHLVA